MKNQPLLVSSDLPLDKCHLNQGTYNKGKVSFIIKDLLTR